jgi:ABC-2 type transport system ATP-binding protein
MKMIKCEALSKYYKGDTIAALDKLNLEVERNSIFGFLGPNGAGKTTTIKILTGLMGHTSGKAWVAGEEASKNNLALKRKIGYLGQEPKMYGWMKGLELLQFVGEIFGLSKAERTKRAWELLEMAGLKEASKKRVSSYSGGMLQRLGIAQAMVSRPKVLLLDEPTSSLDPIGRKEVLDFILSLRADCTVFLSSHILGDVERVCDTVAIINKGKLVAEGDTEALRKKFAPKRIEIEITDMHQMLLLSEYLGKEGLSDKLKRKDNLLSVDTDDLHQDKNKILRFVVENNIDITRLEMVHASLEDVFLKLVGGKDEK